MLVPAIVFTLCNTAISQTHQSIQAVEVVDVSVLNAFGYLTAYTVTLKNKSDKTLDYIGWTANFFNNKGTLIHSDQSSFNSDGIFDPIVSGFDTTILRAPKVEGACKAQIIIRDAHSVDGITFH